MKLLDGKLVAKKIRTKIKTEVKALNTKPGIAVILVGDNPASQIYVNKKKQVAQRLGFKSNNYCLHSSTTKEELYSLIETLNQDDSIHGILLQLPLPKHLNPKDYFHLIHPNKDIDGFHPNNVGNLHLEIDALYPCTPEGVIALLKFYDITIKGQNIAMIGRSNLVGKPLAQMLSNHEGSVSILHHKTKNLKDFTKNADIIITACGDPKFFNSSYLGRPSTLIDVGITKLPSGEICGDMDFEDMIKSPLCKAITPVPGGIGPLTIASLMSNTLKAYKLSKNLL
ncbi:MAG: bifunctional 5,10-methylenetetrahydrofolate dehydrogenase/5,10-methenyltetrahydrofolate cyclohydrolase [Candidatus Cloacimonetes bacterium]|nr:bifunctional 5,10-methylenetetrahydrofolate dehydrogenase/5,10-methenyltetrahydrofolate cyclohydrolase [Candidatus Cloacimonadota bacterium]